MYEIIFNSIVLIISIVASGHFFSKIVLRDLNNFSISYYGVLGIVFLSLLSFIINLFAPLNENISNFMYIFLILSLFTVQVKNKQQIIKFLKKILPIIFLNIFLVSYSNYYDPDGAWYHLPFSRLIHDYKIILGSVSLHPMFGSHSILQYLAALFHNSIIGPNGVLYVNSLIGSFFLVFFYENYLKEKKHLLKIFLFMVLSLFFIEMNRISEYGNDTPAHLFFILTILFSIKILLERKLSPEKFKVICLFSIFTFFIKPLLIFIIFVPIWLFFNNKLFKNFKFIPYFSIFITFFWIIKNTLLTGCLIYPLSFTCFDRLSWYSSSSNFLIAAENSSQFSELHSKGWKKFDQNIQEFTNYKKDLENKNNFKKSFNWFATYVDGGYHYNIIKKIDYLFIYLLFILMIIFFISKKGKLKKQISKIFKDFKKIKILFYLNLFFLLIFLIKFPDGRYGLSYMFVTLYFLFLFAISNLNFQIVEMNKIFNYSLVILFSIFILKNSMRIINQSESSSPHPDINFKKDILLFKEEVKRVENGGIFKIYHGNAKNIRFADKNLCKYYKSPCIPNNKSTDDFTVTKINNYLILKIKEN